MMGRGKVRQRYTQESINYPYSQQASVLHLAFPKRCFVHVNSTNLVELQNNDFRY
jgi:hypothetical protein